MFFHVHNKRLVHLNKISIYSISMNFIDFKMNHINDQISIKYIWLSKQKSLTSVGWSTKFGMIKCRTTDIPEFQNYEY